MRRSSGGEKGWGAGSWGDVTTGKAGRCERGGGYGHGAAPRRVDVKCGPCAANKVLYTAGPCSGERGEGEEAPQFKCVCLLSSRTASVLKLTALLLSRTRSPLRPTFRNGPSRPRPFPRFFPFAYVSRRGRRLISHSTAPPPPPGARCPPSRRRRRRRRRPVAGGNSAAVRPGCVVGRGRCVSCGVCPGRVLLTSAT